MHYRVHRLKEAQSQNYRWTAHTGGAALVKSRDYQGEEGTIEASSPYDAWKQLGQQNQKLRPGDLLELLTDDGQPSSLLIEKYIGFEPAEWFIPGVKMSSVPDGETAA